MALVILIHLQHSQMIRKKQWQILCHLLEYSVSCLVQIQLQKLMNWLMTRVKLIMRVKLFLKPDQITLREIIRVKLLLQWICIVQIIHESKTNQLKIMRNVFPMVGVVVLIYEINTLQWLSTTPLVMTLKHNMIHTLPTVMIIMSHMLFTKKMLKAISYMMKVVILL